MTTPEQRKMILHLIPADQRTPAEDAAFSLSRAVALAQSRRASDLALASQWGLDRARNLRHSMLAARKVLDSQICAETKLAAIETLLSASLARDEAYIQHRQ